MKLLMNVRSTSGSKVLSGVILAFLTVRTKGSAVVLVILAQTSAWWPSAKALRASPDLSSFSRADFQASPSAFLVTTSMKTSRAASTAARPTFSPSSILEVSVG